MTKRVAFVVQRCGADVNGGSEQHCLSVARRMTDHWVTEVLTTCALDYMTWANHYPPGEEWHDRLCIRRFPVERPRDVPAFNQLSESIHENIGHNTLDDEEAWMRAQGPWAPELLSYLAKHKDEYDAFIFFTYLYATTYFGLPLVTEKAHLVPTAHDEWPMRLGLWDAFFRLPKGFVFNTPEEQAFLKGRFPHARLDGPIVGVAVDPPESVSPEAFREKHQLHGPLILYLGRLDPAKGIDHLLEYFQTYQRETGDDRTQLALVGTSVMSLPDISDVHALGFVDEQTKWDALAACDLLVMPSLHESLSMVCLEAWSLGKPVLVNAACAALVGQCRRAMGGLWYHDAEEFVAALAYLLREPHVMAQLGRQGRDYVRSAYSWTTITAAYRDLLTT